MCESDTSYHGTILNNLFFGSYFNPSSPSVAPLLPPPPPPLLPPPPPPLAAALSGQDASCSCPSLPIVGAWDAPSTHRPSHLQRRIILPSATPLRARSSPRPGINVTEVNHPVRARWLSVRVGCTLACFRLAQPHNATEGKTTFHGMSPPENKIMSRQG
jgi:hypothetical protein